jgi:hypothetical protein
MQGLKIAMYVWSPMSAIPTNLPNRYVCAIWPHAQLSPIWYPNDGADNLQYIAKHRMRLLNTFMAELKGVYPDRPVNQEDALHRWEHQAASWY